MADHEYAAECRALAELAQQRPQRPPARDHLVLSLELRRVFVFEEIAQVLLAFAQQLGGQQRVVSDARMGQRFQAATQRRNQNQIEVVNQRSSLAATVSIDRNVELVALDGVEIGLRVP